MIKVYQGADVINAARLALRSHLFVPGWNLSYELRDVVNDGKYSSKICHSISLWFNDDKPDKPVGICVVWRNSLSVKNNKYHHTYDTEFFVRKSYRKRGIAKQLFSSVYPLINNEDKNAKIQFFEGNNDAKFLFDRLMSDYSNTYYRGWRGVYRSAC